MRLHLLLAIKLSVREKNIEDVAKTVVFFLPKMHSLVNMIYNN